MKIVKQRKVVAEEIEIPDGTYYFRKHGSEFFKITLEQDEEITDCVYESVEDYSDSFGIQIEKYSTDEMSFRVTSKFLDCSTYSPIMEEEFNKAKLEVIGRITK